MERSAVLVGLKYPGKTSVGKELARILETEFIDGDEKFSEVFSVTVDDYIKAKGIEDLRRVKALFFEKVCKVYASRQVVFEPGREDILNDGSDYDKKNNELFNSFGSVIYVLPCKDALESARIIYRERGVDDSNIHFMMDAFKKINRGYCFASQGLVYTEGKPLEEIAKQISIMLR